MLDYIAHYGVGADANPPGRGSGRYPKGSGKRPRAGRIGKIFKGDNKNRKEPFAKDIEAARRAYMSSDKDFDKGGALAYGKVFRKMTDAGMSNKDIAKTLGDYWTEETVGIVKKNITNQAVDDYVKVLSKEMSAKDFNKKYDGMGYRIN